MGAVTEHTLLRRLRLLSLIATALEPVSRDDLVTDLADLDHGETRRTFFADLRWLRHELGCDILWCRRERGYELVAVPSEVLRLAEAVSEWQRGRRPDAGLVGRARWRL